MHRAKLELFEHEFVAAQLGRPEHHDLGSLAQPLVGTAREFLSGQSYERSRGGGVRQLDL